MAQNPRVLILADGASIHTQRWLEGLSDVGTLDLFLVSMNPAPVRPEIYKIRQVKQVHQIAPPKISEGGNNFQYLFHLPSIYKVVRKIKPTIISAVYLPSYGFIGALLKGSAKLVQFVVGGDIMIFPNQSWANKAVTKFTLSRSSFVVSASETMSSRIVKNFNYDRKLILTQQYGLVDWVIEYPEKAKDFDFASNRAWVANSNIDYFLKILKQLPQTKPALIGAGVPGSETLTVAINTLSDKIDGCELLGGLPYEENIDYVARSRFLVSLTCSDGASLSVMEAMALGAVPIVSDIAPNREWIEDKVNGFLVPLNDVAGAVKCFKTALALSDSERAEIIRRNKAIIHDRGSLKRNMNKVGKLLVELEAM